MTLPRLLLLLSAVLLAGCDGGEGGTWRAGGGFEVRQRPVRARGVQARHRQAEADLRATL